MAQSTVTPTNGARTGADAAAAARPNGTIVDASNGRQDTADLLAYYKSLAASTAVRPSVERTRQRRADGKLPAAAPRATEPAVAVPTDAATGMPVNLLGALMAADSEADEKEKNRPARTVSEDQRARTLAVRGILLLLAYSDTNESAQEYRFLNITELDYFLTHKLDLARPGVVKCYRYEIIPNSNGGMKAERLWHGSVTEAWAVSGRDRRAKAKAKADAAQAAVDAVAAATTAAQEAGK